MTVVTKAELLKIAAMSSVEVSDEEVPELLEHLQSVLSYAARVQDTVAHVGAVSAKGANVFREDVAIPTDRDPILAQAPDRETDYFVVPKILDN